MKHSESQLTGHVFTFEFTSVMSRPRWGILPKGSGYSFNATGESGWRREKTGKKRGRTERGWLQKMYRIKKNRFQRGEERSAKEKMKSKEVRSNFRKWKRNTKVKGNSQKKSFHYFMKWWVVKSKHCHNKSNSHNNSASIKPQLWGFAQWTDGSFV